jgi:hypothetical protein
MDHKPFGARTFFACSAFAAVDVDIIELIGRRGIIILFGHVHLLGTTDSQWSPGGASDEQTDDKRKERINTKQNEGGHDGDNKNDPGETQTFLTSRPGYFANFGARVLEIAHHPILWFWCRRIFRHFNP